MNSPKHEPWQVARILMFAGLIGLTAVGLLRAQQHNAPSAPAPDTEQSQEDVLEQLLQDASPEPMIMSRFGSDEVREQAVQPVDPKTRVPLTVREGDVVINRLGRLDTDSAGNPLFVYEADGTALSEPPLILLPCQGLEQMERLNQKSPDARFAVTGEVTVYHGKGYLLIRRVMLFRDLGQF